ncbi:MAG: DUF2203 domain-containing protein [Planctomycetota bacterium]
MRGKIFTSEEANRMLPLVARIADDIVRTYRQVHDALRQLDASKQAASEAHGAEAIRLESEIRAHDARVAELLDRFQGLIEEIEALGGTVKDYERGAVDFYGELDGEIVYLSWSPGDEQIAFWHPLEDGAEERRPLPTTITL